MLYLLTGSVACTLRLAAPVAGARSVGPRPRAPGEIRHISSVLVAGGRRILSGRPASLLRADQRLHRECVRLDAHCARGPPLLCHFSRFSRRKERKRDGVTNLSFLFFFFFFFSRRRQEKVQKHRQKSKSTLTVPAGWVRPRGAAGEDPGTSWNNVSVIRESRADFFGECQQPESLEQSRRRATCQSQRSATNQE